jgi:hypothetical protein
LGEECHGSGRLVRVNCSRSSAILKPPCHTV